MSTGRIGFGLVGLGMGAETHARELQHVPEAHLVAVYGRSEDKARAFAQRFGVKRWYSDYRRFLDDREIHVADILTPNGLHQDFAVPAAEAGKHVLVEKPLEISLARADAIIEACRRHRVQLSVIYQMRFGQAARRVKRTLDSGLFGRLLLADVYDKEYRPPSYYANDYWRGTRQYEGGGSLMTQSSHVIDLLQWMAGPVESVFAQRRTALHRIEVEDLVVATVTFRNGAVGVVESATCVSPAFKSRLELHGERGSAIMNGEHDELMFWEVQGFDERIDAAPGFHFKDVSDPRLLPEIRHRLQLTDVVDAIRENRAPSVTGEEARKSLAIILAIYESSKRGEKVTLPES
jgi:predicted dehydrogenase